MEKASWKDLIHTKGRVLYSLLLFIICLSFIAIPKVAHGAASTTPYSVPYSVKSNWNSTYGGKMFTMTSGRDLVYDVYSSKYTRGGYQIVNKNFGKGTQPYLNFQGWAVLFGYHQETKSNNETYLVARKSDGTTKIYSTLLKDIDATEDLEYNNLGSGIYNECSSSTINKRNDDCNMRYESVGFDAYLPLKELFPKEDQNVKWTLYLVKKVNNHIVYTPLILPFTFDNRTYNQGKISLSSGVNANLLIMNSSGVLRRSRPREEAGDVRNELGSDRYFNSGTTYRQIDSEESKTAVWYGVSSSQDNGRKKWAATSYWTFGGSTAVLTYDAPPKHVLDDVLNSRYKSGNNYWYQPGDQGYVRLEQYDETGNKFQYLRLIGSGQEVRSVHAFGSARNNNDQFFTSSHIRINSASREKNSTYGQVKWGFIPYTHGDGYNVEYYYTDTSGNTLGYIDTGKNIWVDGKAPSLSSDSMTGYRYKNGNDYWVRPNDQIYINLRQYDPDSGNYAQYLRLYGSGDDTKSEHVFDSSLTSKIDWVRNFNVRITSASRTEDSDYGQVKWSVIPKTHGKTYDVEYYFQDHVANILGYNSTGMKLRVDGVVPLIAFRNSADTANFTSRIWSNNTVQVRLKFSDRDSGYKQSRYVWTKSTAAPNSWSAWSTDPDYLVSQGSYGPWYLHVQAEDNVGNITTTTKGPYNYNNLPGAGFVVSPNPTDRLTPVKITSTAKDPDGGNLTYVYEVKCTGDVALRVISKDENPTYTFQTVGSCSVKQTVKDPNGGTATITHQVTVNDLAPIAAFTPNPNPTNRLTAVKFTNQSNDPEGDTLTYNWAYQAPNSTTWKTFSTSLNTSFKFPIVGTFNVRLIVKDEYGKTDTVSHQVIVQDLSPVAAFTPNPNPTDRLTKVQFTNQSRDPEGDALTYSWAYQKAGTATWTIFSTSLNTAFVFPTVNVYNVRLTIKDSYGKSSTVIHPVTVKDLAPLAGFRLDLPKYYIGDTVKVSSTATDPESDPLTYLYIVTDPTGVKTTFKQADFSFKLAKAGAYTIQQTITDLYSLSDTAQLTFTSNQLVITGHVDHTEQWQKKHEELKSLPNQFFSGENFLLSADLSPYPANYVKVYFKGTEVNDQIVSKTIPLTKNSPVLYSGNLYDPAFQETETMLKKGLIPFKFEVRYTNGIIRTDVVNVEIIGNVFDSFFHFHESY